MPIKRLEFSIYLFIFSETFIGPTFCFTAVSSLHITCIFFSAYTEDQMQGYVSDMS